MRRLFGIAPLIIWALLSAFPAFAADAPRTLAVMDFEDRAPAAGWGWLGRGLADMLVTDLSQSSRLVVLEREQLAAVLKEQRMTSTGVADATSATRAGQAAKVEWVLFGSFLREGDKLRIEAHLVDVDTQELRRVEWVDGQASDLFKLEKMLAYAVIARLDVPLTESERNSIAFTATDSIPAFEHYSRSLGHFDAGEWYEALFEARLARRNDPRFLKAAIRVGDLYREIGEPDHALLCYRALVDADRENTLPDSTYLKIAALLEERNRDTKGAAMLCEKVLARHPEFSKPFDIREAFKTSHGWADVGQGHMDEVRALAAAHDSAFRALEKLGAIHLKAGEDIQAAQCYSRFVQYCAANGMWFTHGAPYEALHDRIWAAYSGLYWRFVREDRDAALCPPMTLCRLPEDGGEALPGTPPTHGWHEWQREENQQGGVWLAPPEKEIAQIAIAVNCGISEKPAVAGFVQTEWSEPGSTAAGGMKCQQFKVGSGWQTARFDLPPGVRAAKTMVFTAQEWKASFVLRSWSAENAARPAIGRFQVNFDPEEIQTIYLDGKLRPSGPCRVGGIAFTEIPAGEHTVKVIWADGRSASRTFTLNAGGSESFLLSARLESATRTVVGPKGSNTFLFKDAKEVVWLLWDQAADSPLSNSPSAESDVFWATSPDGVKWSAPGRLPVSGPGLDMRPILQQDRLGAYWLVWCSSRDPDDPKWLWIASSQDGVDWSFPRKIVLQIADVQDLARWREGRRPGFGFLCDGRNQFWLVWQGRLFRSENAADWQEVEALKTQGIAGGDRFGENRGCFLGCDAGANLLLLSSRYSEVEGRGQVVPALWRREKTGIWRDVGFVNTTHTESASAAPDTHGGVAVTFNSNDGIFTRTCSADGTWSAPLLIESHVTDPFHPSITLLPDGRFVIAYACKDGIVAAGIAPSALPEELKP